MGYVRPETTQWGEQRFHAVASFKGREVHIGWYTTEVRARKAIKLAEEP